MRGVTRFTMHEQRHGNAFQLTRLMRGVTESLLTMLSSLSFQLTRLMRGVTEKCYSFRGAKKFQLTRLMRGVTSSVEVSTFDIMSFQLTRLMRGVTTHNAEL